MSGLGKRWWLVLALLLSVGVNAGIFSVLAMQRWRGPRWQTQTQRQTARPAGRGQGALDKAADRLHLRGENRQRFIVIHRKFFTENRRGQVRLEELRRQLGRQLSASQPDEDRIEQIVAELGERYAQLDRLLAKTVLASRVLLNRRQEKAYLKMLSRLRAVSTRHPENRNRARQAPRRPPQRRSKGPPKRSPPAPP